MAAAKADIHRYIANLESGQPIPSAEFFGGGKVGAQKRDIIQKIMGFVLTKKQLREGALLNENLTVGLPVRPESASANPQSIGRPLFESDGNTRVTKSFRLDRFGRVQATGENMRFTEGQGYQQGQLNFLPAVPWPATAPPPTPATAVSTICSLKTYYRLSNLHQGEIQVWKPAAHGQTPVLKTPPASWDHAAGSVCAFKSGVIIVLIVTVVLAARAVFACVKALFREELVGRAQVRVTPHGVYYSKTPVQ